MTTPLYQIRSVSAIKETDVRKRNALSNFDSDLGFLPTVGNIFGINGFNYSINVCYGSFANPYIAVCKVAKPSKDGDAKLPVLELFHDSGVAFCSCQMSAFYQRYFLSNLLALIFMG